MLMRDIARGDELLDDHRSSGLDPESAEQQMFSDGTSAQSSIALRKGKHNHSGAEDQDMSKLRGLDESL